MSKPRIDSLTPLRFVACLVIIAFHARGHFGLPPNFGAPFALPQSVSFFFVLSGFIMAFVYPTLKGKENIGKYWLARFARIWPLHFCIFLFYIFLLPEYSHYGPLTVLANLSLVQSWIPNQLWFFSFNGVTWSIGTECFFYLAFPFLIQNFEKNWKLKLTVAFVLAVVMAQIGNLTHAPSYSGDQISVHGLTYINPLSRLFEFVFGMALAGFYRKHIVNRDAPQLVGLACEIGAIAVLLALSANTLKIAHWTSRLPFVGEGGRMYVEYCGISVFTCALLILVIAWGRGPISRILATRPMVFLGEVSFSVYLLHRLFLHYYWNHFAPLQGPGPMILYMTFLLAASYVSWSLIELPFRQMIVKGPASMTLPGLAPCLTLVSLIVVSAAIWNGKPLARLDAATVKNLEASATAPGAEPGVNTGANAGVNTGASAGVNTGASAGVHTGASAGVHTGANTDLADGENLERIGDIAVGDDLRLLATGTKQDEKGLTITLYWKALRPCKLRHYIDLHLLSENNVLVRLKDFRQSQREEVMKQGECFKNVLFVPASELQYVDRLAFSLVDPIYMSKSPKARLIGDHPAGAAARHELNKGLVAVDLPSVSIAGKQTKPAL